jgi:phosphate starvation-inducible protein PhoH
MQDNNEKRIPKTNIKFSIQLSDEQKIAKSEILLHPFNFIVGKPGSGKANWINTPVLTPLGPKLMGEIQKGDYVLSENGEPIEVIEVFPQGVKPIYKITFSDKSTTHCTEEHLWNVISRTNLYLKHNRNGKLNNNYQTYQTLSLKQIKDKKIQIDNRDKWFIPLTKPVEFNLNKELKLDPYILGCLLGDGCFIGTPCITTTDDFILKYFESYFKTLGLDINQQCENSISYNISDGKTKKVIYDGIKYDSVENLIKALKISNGTYYKRKNNGTYIIQEEKNYLTEFLKSYDLYNKNSFTKHIPKDYLYSSIENRISILQGLLDTDGWVECKQSKNSTNISSTTYICTTSEQMKNDIILLVNSLGGICNTNSRMGKWKMKGEKEYKHTSINFRIAIRFNNHDIENRLFKLERKQNLVKLSKNIINRSISDIEYVFDDYAQCILVDSPTHLYLTDNYVVTHNTALAVQIALDKFFKREVNKIIITRPTVATEDNGFLPGTESEKMEPWLVPIYSNMKTVYNKPEVITNMVKKEEIELVSLTHFRGRTFSNAVCIIDEFQNLTKQQLSMALSRLGKGSIMILCGDSSQCDLKFKNDSAIHEVAKLRGCKYVYEVKLKDNHRHEALEEVLRLLETN